MGLIFHLKSQGVGAQKRNCRRDWSFFGKSTVFLGVEAQKSNCKWACSFLRKSKVFVRVEAWKSNRRRAWYPFRKSRCRRSQSLMFLPESRGLSRLPDKKKWLQITKPRSLLRSRLSQDLLVYGQWILKRSATLPFLNWCLNEMRVYFFMYLLSFKLFFDWNWKGQRRLCCLLDLFFISCCKWPFFSCHKMFCYVYNFMQL